MNHLRPASFILFALVCALVPRPSAGQEAAAPALRAGVGAEGIDIDGRLDEPAWKTAEMVDAFTQIDPQQGVPATFRTEVRVLTSRNALIVGIVCQDAEPSKIVSFSVRRDASLTQEDYLRV